MNQSEFDALNKEYETFIHHLQANYLSQNKVDSKDVYEVMHPNDRAKVDGVIVSWAKYITPLAEAWWKERGCGVIWPDDNSKPMQVYKLELV